MIDQFIKNITTDQKIIHCKDCIFAEKTHLPNLGINIYDCNMIKNHLVMKDGGYCANGMTELQYQNLVKYRIKGKQVDRSGE